MLTGLYVPGDSLVHRARPGVKLAVLALALLLLTAFESPVAVSAGAAATLVTTVVARVGTRPMLAQLRPVFWFAAGVGALQVWTSGPVHSAVVVGYLVVAIAMGALVTLTTRSQDLLDTLVTMVSPLRRFGVNPERVGLVFSLTISSVPVLLAISGEVRDARRARGAERSVRAYAVPLVIRAVRRADLLGQALIARGVDD